MHWTSTLNVVSLSLSLALSLSVTACGGTEGDGDGDDSTGGEEPGDSGEQDDEASSSEESSESSDTSESSTDTSEAEESSTDSEESSTTGTPGEPLLTDMRMFVFGHSLINHEFTNDPPPSNELSVPHWQYLLAQEAGYDYAATGQYGFLLQHINLPPIAQWGFDIVPAPWDSDAEPFADADFTTVMLTPANFVQYKPAIEPYDGENPDAHSPVSATTTIVEWVGEQEPGAQVYIYENWPDMAGFIASFPPTPGELAGYHEHTLADFHDWWLDYQDAVLVAAPDANVRMIPVGPILATLLTDSPLSAIPIEDLYEDDAPHGRPTLYFLAGLITTTATYGVPAPEGFAVPELVHPLVAEHYDEVVARVWDELDAFTDERGVSRVW